MGVARKLASRAVTTAMPTTVKMVQRRRSRMPQ
jgi:hypothetical protein